MFSHIKVLVWDFDGTLYAPSPDLWKKVREAEYRVIENHTRWKRDRVVAEFVKLHKRVLPSATEVTAHLCGITIAQAAVEMEVYFDRRDYVTRDEQLIGMFRKLTNFRHFILANGVKKRHIETLAVLGLPPATFEMMVTTDVVGVTKPHEEGYRVILAETLLPPNQHLMIGDREAIDLIPAKKLGMKTCLVWSQEQSKIADITLPTVYDIVKILVE